MNRLSLSFAAALLLATNACSSSSGSSSGSSSSSSGGEVDAGPIPTTCAQANQEIGCCSGNTNYYCSTSLQSTVCTDGQVCGWGGSNYTCVNPPGGAGGGEPIDCQ